MPLQLTVLSFKDLPLNEPISASITAAGGTIGRGHDNDLVLPDTEKIVSRLHASIHQENGVYYLTDKSSNGVLVDDSFPPLQNNSQPIFDGTHLKIGDYKIRVSITDEDFSLAVADSENDNGLLSDAQDFFTAESDTHSLLTAEPTESVTHEDLLQQEPQNPFQPLFTSQLESNRDSLSDCYNPPDSTLSHPVELPKSFCFADLLIDPETVQPELTLLAEENTPPTPVVQQQPIISDKSKFCEEQPNEAWLDFLAGAGIETVAIDSAQIPDTMHRVGVLFRKWVDGMVTLLRSRAEFKSLFRLGMTVIRPTQNNPLKFSISTDDTLQQLLENKTTGFLNATTAVDEGFADMMSHQLAMQAGIQAALEDLLVRLSPEQIEKQFEQGLVLQKKAKCWDRFKALHKNAQTHAIEDFYGEAFVKAYEAQLRILQSKSSHNQQ